MPIRVLEFWTDYKPNPSFDPKVEGSDRLIGRDMVKYCCIGKKNFSVQTAYVNRLKNVLDPSQAEDGDMAPLFALKRWEIIGPAYDAWRAGNELPETGTPLGAWSGVSQDQAAALKLSGIKTVEDMAGLGDGVLGKINLPNMRALRKSAQSWLDSADSQVISNQMAEKDAQIAALKSDMAELKELVVADHNKSKKLRKPISKPKQAEAEIAA